MVSFPPCKINLGLHITGKRPDGYHTIETCFYPVPWHDVLEIVPAQDFSFSVSGHPVPGAATDNLCVRAYELLKKAYPLKPVSIHLLKIIPIGAGLGGGSSDAAYTLRSLNELFKLGLENAELSEFASRLGSDCSFFIEGKPMIGTGRGEMLSGVALALKGKYLVIIKPEVHISTTEAYRLVTAGAPARDLREVVEKHSPAEWRKLLTNDFEPVLFKKFPIIEAIHQKLYAVGATYAAMSGSGSAVFGLFENEVDLKKDFESLQYWSGYLD
jgi:4-diphosphocytidyl-2-C-methyl-D-erythritol kinase